MTLWLPMVSHAQLQHIWYQLTIKGAPGTWIHLKQQSGMFGFLGLSPDVVTKLRGKTFVWKDFEKQQLNPPAEQYHVYMASNSRISIAGLNTSNVDYVAQSIKKCLEGESS